MSFYHYKAKKKRGSAGGIAPFFLLGVAIVSGLSILFPSLTGRFGQIVHNSSLNFAGWSSLVLPVYLGWLAVQHLLRERGWKKIRDAMLFTLIFISLSALLSIVSSSAPDFAKVPSWGGWVGNEMSGFFAQQFGKILVFCLSLLVTAGAVCFLAGISPISLLALLKEKISQDIADWKAERERLREENELRKKLDADESGKAPGFLTGIRTLEESERGDKSGGLSLGPLVHPIPNLHLPSKLEPISAGRTKMTASNAASTAGNDETATAAPDYQGYILPDLDLLQEPDEPFKIDKEELYAKGTLLEKTLEQFNVKAKVVDIHPGPVITRYDLSPAPGVRVQSIDTLANDIALAMKAQSLRVLAPVPGKAAVGIEIANPHPATVRLKEILLAAKFQEGTFNIPLALGKSAEGDSLVADLTSMPHLLIAGATGSGKSVCIHSLVLSILFRFRPDEVKLFLIDPKRLELPGYDGIPHLYDPAVKPEEVKTITQPKDVVLSLKKLVDVMEKRYEDFAKLSVRNIESYNEKAKAQGLPTVAYIVVIIDELADLMIVVGKEIEDLIQRLAQMARAVGIHLVLATQRPSVDVITGVIKANLPSRIAFQVLSKTDSRVILDSQGAEDLLGRGDMLFLATGAPRPVRLQGAFVSEKEVSRIVEFIREQQFKPHYESMQTVNGGDSIVDNEENRGLLLRAAKVIRDTEKVSGDLLRADKEIGSKYDMALTLLKKKGLIEKPKDTNRWKIHFDLLNEYLEGVEKNS